MSKAQERWAKMRFVPKREGPKCQRLFASVKKPYWHFEILRWDTAMKKRLSMVVRKLKSFLLEKCSVDGELSEMTLPVQIKKSKSGHT